MRRLAKAFAIFAGFVLTSWSASCALAPLPCAGVCGGGGATATGPYHLTAAVDVRRDEHGVVHVYGKTDQDVLYGSGYMQAVDRLFEMELQKRHAQGREAEVFGSSHLQDDEIIRVIGIPKLGHANAEAMRESDPDVYAITHAWVSGVNARIAEISAGKAPLPTGFGEMGFMPEPWTVDDAYSIAKMIVFGNGNQLEFDALATLLHRFNADAYGKIPFFKPLADEYILDTSGRSLARTGSPTNAPTSTCASSEQPPAGAQEKLTAFLRSMRRYHPGASNNFAVDGRHTASGHSMIAGDPHQPLRSPSLMWMSHLNSADQGGRLDVEGWSFVGTPGVSLGHNRDIAWTATTNYPDVTDLWDIAVDGGTATIGGQTVKVESHDEAIPVKGEPAATITVETVPGYGVILPDDLFPLPLAKSGRRVLFNWTGFRVTNEARAFAEVALAKSLDEFDAAIDRFELGSFNFVAASRDGITYRSSPLVPDRGDPSTHAPAYEMMSGDDPANLWTGAFLELDRLPHSRAQSTGFIVTANNDPFGFSGDGVLTNDPYYFGTYFDPGLRAKRIHDDLVTAAASHKLTESDMIATQTDVHSLLADELLSMLATSYAKVPTDASLAGYRNRPDLDQLAALLSSWDRRMSREQAAPVAFEAFMYLLVRDVLHDELGLFFDPIMGQEPIYLIKFAVLALRAGNSPIVKDGNDVALVKALDETSAFLQQRFGKVNAGFLWKDFHQTSFPSDSIPLFDGGTTATDGGEATVNVSSGSFFDGSNIAQHHVSDSGSIYRMVATFDDAGRPHAVFDFARGNSAEPGNTHYDDETNDWANERYEDMHFDSPDIDAHTAPGDRLTLSP